MGRVKGSVVKRTAEALFEKYPGYFVGTEAQIKEKVRKLGFKMVSKPEFNKVCGELAVHAKKLARKQKDETANNPTVATV